MKRRHMYSLFFICALVILLVLFFIWERCELLSSIENNDYCIDGENNDIMKIGKNNAQEKNESDNRIYLDGNINKDNTLSEVVNENIVINAETLCIFEDIDKKDGSMTLTEKKLPSRFYGIDREGLQKIIDASNEFKGENNEYEAVHLELFSAEKIKILRIYDSTSKDKEGKNKGYYLLEKDGKVCIYKSDKSTIFYESELKLKDLPFDIQREVLKGKYLETEIQVYHFLESYSS